MCICFTTLLASYEIISTDMTELNRLTENIHFIKQVIYRNEVFINSYKFNN